MSAWLSAIKGYIYRSTIESKGKETSVNVPAQKCNHCRQNLNDCHLSQIDHHTRLNCEQWSVSLLIHKGDNVITDLFSHHVVLIIEGFTEKGKFWRKAHLMGPGTYQNKKASRDCYSGHGNIGQVQVTDEKYSPFSLTRFKKNRQTWGAPRHKIELLLKDMLLEQENPESTPFRFLGEKSLASMTREYLDANVPELIELKNKHPKDFKRLCRLTRYNKKYEQYTKGLLNNTGATPLIATAYLMYLFVTRVFVAREMLLEGHILKAGLLPLVTKAFPSLRDSISNQYWFNFEMSLSFTSIPVALFVAKSLGRYYDLNPGKEIMQQLQENEEEVRLVQEKAIVTLAVAQNCFNWARRHLKKIGVTLQEDRWIERFIVIPELYVSQEKKRDKILMEAVD
ncbi:MAG: hypothetical protein JSS10_00185 [Verrucomicrobia bacterium]|nr:hypothetical protein [Verrucomicrobiota bacterium]